MRDQSEKARRKQLSHSLRDERKKAVREGLPASPAMMKALFRHIDLRLEEGDCNDTFRYAREFISQNNLPEGAVVAWLEENGGYCDCEAVYNAEQVLQDALPDNNELPS